MMQARATWLLLGWVVAVGTATAATVPPGDVGDDHVLRFRHLDPALTAYLTDQLVALTPEGDPAQPRVWLGVRLARVPDALKAHLGRDGIMVANVVVDSPADDAGLKRYDVIVSLDGKPVERFEDLQRILAEIEPGARVEMEIIRGGKVRTLTIRPRRRPRELGEVRFKYEEPAGERDMMRYFGGRLRQRPDGSWEFEPLGRLRDLLPHELDEDDIPQELREQWREMREQLRKEMSELREKLRGLREKDFGWWARRQPPDGFQWWWFSPHEDADEDAHVRLRLELRDDEHIVIEKDEEGWHVVRESEDGKRSEADYDDLDQLRKDDPDAYDVLRRHLRVGGGFYFRLPPMHRLPELQERFEEEFRESLREHRRRGAREQAKPAPRSGERRSRRTRITRDREREQIFVVQREGGRIVVRVMEEGREPKTYTFDDLDELREQMPEVYEQARELFEDEP